MELRHLRYFVVCADVKSFSKAAEILYTTQPNISKVINTLEKELEIRLFIRKKSGIQLTPKGRYIYQYANQVLSTIDQMNTFSRESTVKELLISSNPSSWMATRFAEFYNFHADEQIRFQLYSANIPEIINRITQYRDEIGFVYLIANQKTAFEYVLEKHKLEFVLLNENKAVLYLGRKHQQYGTKNIKDIDWDQIELVQNYSDELTQFNFWDLREQEGKRLSPLKIKVISNSDSVVEQLLGNTKLANISGGYLTDELDERDFQGISLPDTNQVQFGYIKRAEESLSFWARQYVDYIKMKICYGQNETV